MGQNLLPLVLRDTGKIARLPAASSGLAVASGGRIFKPVNNIAIPSAFTKKTGEAHWHVLNRARAIENCAFVVAPCAVGPVDGGGESYGHSLIINPWGEILADGGTLPGVVHATIELDQVAAARAKIPSLAHDRPFASAGGDPRRMA